MKRTVTILIVFIFKLNSFGQIADYNITGYHVQKFDSFLENFSNYNESCYNSNTFKMFITSNKMRIEIDDSNENGESYVKDIQIGIDLPLDSGAQVHKAISGLMKKPIYIPQTNVSKYETLKFKGRFYAHKFTFNDLITDKVDGFDIFFVFEYENGEKENFYFHLSQKSAQQIEAEKLKTKIQSDLAEINNKKNMQIIEEQRIQEEQLKLQKTQKTEKSMNDFNNLMNQIINLQKK